MPHEIEATIEAIRAVRAPRFLTTERGYHGAFYCALRSALEKRDVLSEHKILEMEYQKSERHGLSQRPDIVLHVPSEVSERPVNELNFAVWALKRDANKGDAAEDFRKLDQMCFTLGYPLGIFVNIDATSTQLEFYEGNFRERFHAFAVPGANRRQMSHEYFQDGMLRTEVLPLR